MTPNASKCGKCNDIIVSRYRHDFKFCKCGAIAVDGGNAYIRRLGRDHVPLTKEELEALCS